MVRFYQALPKHALVFVFVFALFLQPSVRGEDAVPLPCPLPEALTDSPLLQSRYIEFCLGLAGAMDYYAGAGTGQVARILRSFSEEVLSAPLSEINATGLSFEGLRAFVLAATGGEKLELPVLQHRRVIDQGNIRLERAGFDFIRFVRAPQAEELPALEVPLPQHGQRYSAFMKARLAVSMGVAFTGGLVGSGFSLPGLSGALTAAGLETQFAVFSGKWAKFWDRFGFKGNIAVNVLYGVIVSSAQLTTEYLLGDPLSLNPQEFFVKSVLIGTTTFVASFGAMQIAAARLLQNGEFSESPRFTLENYSVFLNNFGRVLALSAAGLGVQHELLRIYGVKFGTGELIGWGIQLAYIMAVTAPFWLKLSFGDKAYDAVTAYQVAHTNDPAHPWNRGLWGRVRKTCAGWLAAAANFYTPTRTNPVN